MWEENTGEGRRAWIWINISCIVFLCYTVYLLVFFVQSREAGEDMRRCFPQEHWGCLPACLPASLPALLAVCCRETHPCPSLCLSCHSRFSQPERRKATWRSKRRGQRRETGKEEEEGKERLVTMFWRGDKTKKSEDCAWPEVHNQCVGWDLQEYLSPYCQLYWCLFCPQGTQVHLQDCFSLSFSEDNSGILPFLSLIHLQILGILTLSWSRCFYSCMQTEVSLFKWALCLLEELGFGLLTPRL